MPHIPENEILKMVEVTVEISAPEEVILFGSQATGEVNPRSDVDFLVIMPDSFHHGYSRRDNAIRIERALSHFPYSKDVLVISRDEAEYWRDSLNNVIARAPRTGRSLYERSKTSIPAVVAR